MTDRDQRISSIRIIDEYHWIMLRHLDLTVRARHGELGIAALRDGLRFYGRYRGETLRQHPLAFAAGRDAMTLLQAWDHANLALASTNARLQIEGDARRATVRLTRAPGSDYFARHDDATILAVYWGETLAGLAEGYDEALSVDYPEIPSDRDAPWAITFPIGADVRH